MKRAFTIIELLTIVLMIAILAAIAVPNFLEAQVRTKVARTHADMGSLVASARAYFADHGHYPLHHPDVTAFFDAVALRGELASLRSPRWTQLDEFARPIGVETAPAVDPTILQTPPDSQISWTSSDAANDPRPMDASLWYSGPGPSSRYTPRFPPFFAATFALNVLTTPVAYLSQEIPTDTFADTRGLPLRYVNLSEVQTSHTMLNDGLRRLRFYVMSYGPDTDQSEALSTTMTNPVTGPYVSYDPTNGTVSAGDIFHFGSGE